MTRAEQKLSRREQILQALASMLEQHAGEPITTAALARAVGVTEAALYRHFPSKARMFEGLLDFAEEAVFSRLNVIAQDEPAGLARLQQAMVLVLAFIDRNPGIARLLNGDALIGEHERLQARAAQYFERIEVVLRQLLRDLDLREQLTTRLPGPATAQLLLTLIEGRLSQFVRSGFRRKPLDGWPEQWGFLAANLFLARGSH